MKKFITLLLLIISAIFFTACNSSNISIDSSTNSETEKKEDNSSIFDSLFGILDEEEEITPPIKERPQQSGTTTISFIEFNDFHANLMPHNEQHVQESKDISIEKNGGLARIKHKIDEMRESHSNTILMSIGDTYHGTAEALFSNGNMIVDLVNRLNVDIGVIGNWDYAYGPIITHTRFGHIAQDDVLRPNFPMIAANAYCAKPDDFDNFLIVKIIEEKFNCQTDDLWLEPTKMIQRDGINVGFIGLTSDIVDKMHKFMGFNLNFTQGEENYKTLIEKYATRLREQGADMVVVMSELGIHKDYALAKVLDKSSVDLFFSAHTHELTKEPLITPSGIYVVESGNDTYLGEMVVTFNENREIEEMKWGVYTIDSSVEEDKEMAELIALNRAPMLVSNPNLTISKVQLESMPDIIKDIMPSSPSLTLKHSLDEVLAHTTLLLDRRDALESNFNNVITDLMRNRFETDVAMTPGFRFDSTVVEHNHAVEGKNYYFKHENEALLSGDVTTADVYRFFPAPYHLAKGEIKGSALKSIIEQNLNSVFSTNTFEQAGGWFDGYSGLSMELNLSKKSNERIISLKYSKDDSMVNDSDTILVVGCARPFDMDAETTLCSYNRFTNVEDIENGEGNYVVSDFFIDEIRNGNLDTIINRKNITNIANTPSWIESGYYQPLEGAK